MIALARRMKKKPTLLGYSMGGRVALEALLTEPGVFRSGIHHRTIPSVGEVPLESRSSHCVMSPELVMRMPIEVAWPLLKRLADTMSTLPTFRDDAVAQAGARLIYNFLVSGHARGNGVGGARVGARSCLRSGRTVDASGTSGMPGHVPVGWARPLGTTQFPPTVWPESPAMRGKSSCRVRDTH